MNSPQNLRTLIVEDAPNWQRLFANGAKQKQYDVVIAKSFAEGLKALDNGPYELAIIDVSLVTGDISDSSGLTLAKKAWESHCVRSFVIASGHRDKSLVYKALGKEMTFTFLSKGEIITIADLHCVIDEATHVKKKGEIHTIADLHCVIDEATHVEKKGEIHTTNNLHFVADESTKHQKVAKQIFVAEDSPNWLRLIKKTLITMGLSTEAAQSYPHGLSILRRKPFDLAIIDLGLACKFEPENLHGILLLEWLTYKKIKTIIVSGLTPTYLTDALMEEFGTFHIFDKETFEVANFRDTVIEALDDVAELPSPTPYAESGRRKRFEKLIKRVLDENSMTKFGGKTSKELVEKHQVDINIDEDLSSLRTHLGLNSLDKSVSGEASAPHPISGIFGSQGICRGCRLVPSSHEYFVGHEFSDEKIGDLRSAIEKGLSVTDLQQRTADQEVYTTLLLCKISGIIQTTLFSFFDLPESQNRNVYLELGLAIGLERPFILIKKVGTPVPALIDGLDHIQFPSYWGLRRLLSEQMKIVPGCIPIPMKHAQQVEQPYLLLVGDGDEEIDFIHHCCLAVEEHKLKSRTLIDQSTKHQPSLNEFIALIQGAIYCVCRIDEGASALSFLATGMAIAFGKPCIFVARNNREIPSDLRGLGCEHFDSFFQLQKLLNIKVKEKNGNYF
ncbi:MAG: hypothetical protein NPIRA05_01930 [Nitrospirales bacterium]|nr:MAG: hypothetical protein NPIRA05_01930 [Nitrospirales bacterium]